MTVMNQMDKGIQKQRPAIATDVLKTLESLKHDL